MSSIKRKVHLAKKIKFHKLNTFVMKNLMLIFIITSLIFTGCRDSINNKQNSSGKGITENQEKSQVKTNSFTEFIPSIVKIESFDNSRFLESETAFFVGENELVCRLSALKNATDAKITPLNEDRAYHISGYLSVDRINDLILLQAEGIQRTPIPLHEGIVLRGTKSIYLTKPQNNTLPLHSGQVLSYTTISGVKRYRLDNQFYSKSFGTPVFDSARQCIGMGFSEVVDFDTQHLAIPSVFIASLLKSKAGSPKKLETLQTKTSQATSQANSRIKGLLIETDYGNIQIRLFNETPGYRDNFIRLVQENFYDSLLVHRVIKGFGIQSGAADTRYAEAEDVVGWKGPGYTLPAHIVPGFFHKRGMIGSPRKPDRGNSKRRSDGSQYYIVTGRTYLDSELDEIEKENGRRFSAGQRQVYKTTGGAPHLDGTYTIFGEVTSGLEIADRIAQVKTDKGFRPLKDIRVKKISVIN